MQEKILRKKGFLLSFLVFFIILFVIPYNHQNLGISKEFFYSVGFQGVFLFLFAISFIILFYTTIVFFIVFLRYRAFKRSRHFNKEFAVYDKGLKSHNHFIPWNNIKNIVF